MLLIGSITTSCPAASPTAVTPQQSDHEIEYNVKAAFIYNFMKFIEWPADKKAELDKEQGQKTPMTIVIVGDNPFGRAFEPILGKSIQGRTIQIVTIPGFQEFAKQPPPLGNLQEAFLEKYASQLTQCDVLFICRSEKANTDSLLKITGSHAVLTVSDISDFANHVGMIGFVQDDNKVRFDINLKTAAKENIKIRSQLLSLARKIHEKE